MAALRGAFWIVVALLVFGWFLRDDEQPSASHESSSPRPELVRQPDATFPKTQSNSDRPTRSEPDVWLYTTANVRLRAAPSTNAEIFRTLAPGERVQQLSTDGKWRQVIAGQQIGWVHGDYLSGSAPSVTKPKSNPIAPLVLRQPAAQKRIGAPIRSPYTGRCDCPYDRKRNGHRCGGTSAWSRPGGRSPLCYVGE
jgi:uncharacterized protein YraI